MAPVNPLQPRDLPQPLLHPAAGLWEPLQQLTWDLFQAQQVGSRGQQGQRCHSSDSQNGRAAGRGSPRVAGTHRDPVRGTVSRGRQAGTRLRQGRWRRGWGALTSRPPCRDQPLSLQPPVGTAGSRRPWALTQTVPTWSLWAEGRQREKQEVRGGGGREAGRDPETVGDAGRESRPPRQAAPWPGGPTDP